MELFNWEWTAAGPVALLAQADPGVRVWDVGHWFFFAGVLAVLLGTDIYVHRGDRVSTRRHAIKWTIVWVSAGMLFNLYVCIAGGWRAGQEFLAAYLMEESLSIDNLFVFLIIFRSMRIPKEHQRKALSWGVFGALVFRAIFIFLGSEALERWHWVAYIFAVLLLYAAWHAFRENPADEEESTLVDWLAVRLPVSKHTERADFFTRENGALRMTPLLVTVIGLELTDVMFAIDSVPAAFSVFDNPQQADRFIVYSSNVFAILGLRSLFIAMSAALADLRYLHYGLAAVLAFAGMKILLADWIPIDPLLSVGIILVCIGVAIWFSVGADRSAEPNDPPPDANSSAASGDFERSEIDRAQERAASDVNEP